MDHTEKSWRNRMAWRATMSARKCRLTQGRAFFIEALGQTGSLFAWLPNGFTLAANRSLWKWQIPSANTRAF